MDRKRPELSLPNYHANTASYNHQLNQQSSKYRTVLDLLGVSEIALRTGSARESTGYGQGEISKGNNVGLLGRF